MMREGETETEFDMRHAIWCLECNRKATQIHIHAMQENCDHKWERLDKVRKMGCFKCFKVMDII